MAIETCNSQPKELNLSLGGESLFSSIAISQFLPSSKGKNTSCIKGVALGEESRK